jgi:6-pyruvoyltetrahydropterin/6-carboxytetrahydropterin synthase
MAYASTKTFGPFSACFRNWRALSHCHLEHGHDLYIDFEFYAEELDDKQWVVDFGGMKTLRADLEDLFDHKLLISEDDPELDTFKKLHDDRLADLRIVAHTSCEKFAEQAAGLAIKWLSNNGYGPRVTLTKVICRETNSNGGVYYPEYP